MKGMLTVGLLLTFSVVAIADELPKVATEKTPVPKVIAPELAKVLGASYKVTGTDGKEIANLWIRDAIPVTGMDEPPLYSAMEEGTFVGVLEIKSDDMTDFRDQKLSPGIFTMRLGIQPSDGNHMGVAPFPEFLCLSPAEQDKTLAPIAHEDLMKLSKEVAGTGHPTVIFMQPFFEKPSETFPHVNENESANIVVNVMAKGEREGKAVDFPIGIIIVGTTTAE